MTVLNKFKRYFWDVDVTKLNPQTKREYIIARLLDKGDKDAILWIEKYFSKKQIIHTLYNYRDFSLKSASFWALIYGADLSKLKCFQTPYLKERRNLWPH